MANTDVQICNLALSALGAELITTLDEDDESDQVTVLALHYPQLLDEIYGMYPWRFASEFAQASRDATYTAIRWQYRYIIPPASKRIIAIYDTDAVGADPITRFQRVGRYLLSDEQEMWVEYVTPQNIANWPSTFLAFVWQALAARIAMQVTGKLNHADYFAQRAWGVPQELGEGGAYATAKHADATSSPPRRVRDFSLVRARFGGDVRLR